MKKICLLGIILGTFALQPTLCASSSDHIEEGGVDGRNKKKSQVDRVQEEEKLPSLSQSPSRKKSESKIGQQLAEDNSALKSNQSSLIASHNSLLREYMKGYTNIDRLLKYVLSPVIGCNFGGLALFLQNTNHVPSLSNPYFAIPLLLGGSVLSSLITYNALPSPKGCQDVALEETSAIFAKQISFDEDSYDEAVKERLSSVNAIKRQYNNERVKKSLMNGFTTIVAGGAVVLAYNYFFGKSSG